jgi:MoxR-like ATPase
MTKLIVSGCVPQQPNPAVLLKVDEPPPWRRFQREQRQSRRAVVARTMPPDQERRARTHIVDERQARIIEAALALRRPILITGPVGVGKSSLAYAIAWQLGLGPVLRWSITSRSTLAEALYQYDVIGRLNQAALLQRAQLPSSPPISDYMRLGPLGTAMLPNCAKHYFPRVLLIDEIDKCDADLPSDLLHVLEEGQFEIPEVARLPDSEKLAPLCVRTADGPDGELGFATISTDGVVCCDDFPLIVMTSNGEREFSPAFLRRCLQLRIGPPDAGRLREIVDAHLDGVPGRDDWIDRFLMAQRHKTLSTDQLLNALFVASNQLFGDVDWGQELWCNLDEGQAID